MAARAQAKRLGWGGYRFPVSHRLRWRRIVVIEEIKLHNRGEGKPDDQR